MKGNGEHLAFHFVVHSYQFHHHLGISFPIKRASFTATYKQPKSEVFGFRPASNYSATSWDSINGPQASMTGD